MVRDAPADPGSSVAPDTTPNICRETVSPAFRSSRSSLEKWLRDSNGATVEAVTGAAGQARRGVDVIGELVASSGVHREDGPGPVDGDVRGQQLGVGQGHQGAPQGDGDQRAAGVGGVGGGGGGIGPGGSGRGIYIRKVDCLEKCGFQTASLW